MDFPPVTDWTAAHILEQTCVAAQNNVQLPEADLWLHLCQVLFEICRTNAVSVWIFEKEIVNQMERSSPVRTARFELSLHLNKKLS